MQPIDDACVINSNSSTASLVQANASANHESLPSEHHDTRARKIAHLTIQGPPPGHELDASFKCPINQLIILDTMTGILFNYLFLLYIT